MSEAYIPLKYWESLFPDNTGSLSVLQWQMKTEKPGQSFHSLARASDRNESLDLASALASPGDNTRWKLMAEVDLLRTYWRL